MFTEKQKTIAKWICIILTAAVSVIAAIFGLQSCSATRVITNESSYLQRGDTSVVIQTRTIERYDASKK